MQAMFDAIAPRYETCNRVLTFGLDGRWRRRAVRALDLAPGARVVDVACGTGDLLRLLDQTGFAPLGIDSSPGMLASASPRCRGQLLLGDALALPLPDGVADGATCGFALRNFVAVEPFLAEVARVVRTGGRLALLEVAEPRRAALRVLHRLWFERAVPRIGGWLSDREAYAYLPRSVAYLPSPNDLLAAMGHAGFVELERRILTGGAAQLLVGTRL